MAIGITLYYVSKRGMETVEANVGPVTGFQMTVNWRLLPSHAGRRNLSRDRRVSPIELYLKLQLRLDRSRWLVIVCNAVAVDEYQYGQGVGKVKA